MNAYLNAEYFEHGLSVHAKDESTPNINMNVQVILENSATQTWRIVIWGLAEQDGGDCHWDEREYEIIGSGLEALTHSHEILRRDYEEFHAEATEHFAS